MAMTTVKIWSENPGDPTAEGLDIGGIQISYAELVDIDSRETALDRGVTPDLIDLWNRPVELWDARTSLPRRQNCQINSGYTLGATNYEPSSSSSHCAEQRVLARVRAMLPPVRTASWVVRDSVHMRRLWA